MTSKNFKSLAQKLGHIFEPITSFEHLTNPPTEKEVVCRFIAIFDNERNLYHNSSSAESSAFPILAKELIEGQSIHLSKHGIGYWDSAFVDDNCQKRSTYIHIAGI